MNKPVLPPDDLPPTEVNLKDELLLRLLEEDIGRRLLKTCGQIIRVLLSSCDWYIQTNTRGLTLIIVCRDHEIYWHILNAVPDIAKKLKRFSKTAIIRLCPPINSSIPWEISVNEIFPLGESPKS